MEFEFVRGDSRIEKSDSLAARFIFFIREGDHDNIGEIADPSQPGITRREGFVPSFFQRGYDMGVVVIHIKSDPFYIKSCARLQVSPPEHRGARVATWATGSGSSWLFSAVFC